MEDAYVKAWQEAIHVGCHITVDESQCTGWYLSCITIGPEPKPARTGATLHTAAVTHGRLCFYKIFARAFGGQTDKDLQGRNQQDDKNENKEEGSYLSVTVKRRAEGAAYQLIAKASELWRKEHLMFRKQGLVVDDTVEDSTTTDDVGYRDDISIVAHKIRITT